MFVEDESRPVYDTDNEEEESMPAYDTNIEYVNEEEEDGNKDEVVYAYRVNQNELNRSVDNGNYSLGNKLGMGNSLATFCPKIVKRANPIDNHVDISRAGMKDTHVAHVNTGVLDMMRKNGLPAQDSFGRWMNYIIAVSPGAIDDPFLNPEPFFIILKVKQKVTFDRLQKFLVLAPQLTELGIGTLSENLVSSSVKKLESAFSKCGNLHTLSGFWDASLVYIPGVYPVCSGLTFLNLSYSELGADELKQILTHCKRLTRPWALDTVRGKGLEAVGSHCPLLKELRVLPADPFDPQTGVSKSGLVAVSNGCPKLHYILYFCHRMTNAAKPHEPDYLTNEPMDKAFGAIVKTCVNLQRL
ncbi:transport inhibitor response 1-like protein [Tanacetum coccineum]